MKRMKDRETFTMDRRTFMAGSVAGSLILGFGGLTAAASARAELGAKRFAPNVWFEMGSNGKTVVNIAEAEMGQHVGTALARILADELGVTWGDVSIRHVDSEPDWGYRVTGGSWSVWSSFTQMSQAGAAGRMVLLDAGAALLGNSAEHCSIAESRVSCGEQSITFADIVKKGNIDRVFTADELGQMPVKAAADRTLIGKSAQALDIPAKASGTAIYGIDAEIDGMVYARPVMPPTRYGSEVLSVDDSAAKKVRGYQGYQTLTDPSGTLQGWVTAIASSQWGAIKAADVIKVTWKPGPTADVTDEQIQSEGNRLVNDSSIGTLFVNEGDFNSAIGESATQVNATYRTSSVLHFQLEPVNATVEHKDGIWHIHAGNQWQSLILPVLAAALETEESNILIHQYYLGGGFGRRLWGDYMLPAALTAKAIGKPVKSVFTREDDARFDCIRSPSVARFVAGLDDHRKVVGIEHAAAAGWPTLTMAPGFLGDGVDGKGKFDSFSISSADHWYTLPHHRVRAINNELAQKTFLPGWLRSVGPGWVNFGVESFMDELAHAAGKNPIDFRLSMLDGAGKNAGEAPNSVGGASRLANVLKRLRKRVNFDEKGGTDQGIDTGIGIALGFGQERNMPTWTACAAKVRVDRASGIVTVTDIYEEIDCGTVVHPDGALAQAEGGALWGLSMALHEGTTIKDGEVSDQNLDSYSPLRLADIPRLHIEFVESTDTAVGLGEPPVTVVAPAIANAIFNAVGARVRELPIRPDAVKAALS